MNKADYNIVYFRQHVVATEQHHMSSPAMGGLAEEGYDQAPKPSQVTSPHPLYQTELRNRKPTPLHHDTSPGYCHRHLVLRLTRNMGGRLAMRPLVQRAGAVPSVSSY